MYQAIIARISTKPHPNADRILLGDVLGNQVVVGLDTKDGELGVYFPTDGLLSHEFCLHNNLYNQSARATLGLPPSDKLGFFDHHRRIRTQKFRGEKSDGLWMPLHSLYPFGDIEYLEEGNMLTNFNGYEICEKWYSRKPRSASGPNVNKRARKSGEIPGFPKHMDTDQWAYYKDQIPVDSLITVSEKLHGTSHRVGLVLDDERQWWQFWKPRWIRLDGSRNVIIGATSGQGFYGSDDFRQKCTPNIGRKGEVLFGEIVGYHSADGLIMPTVTVDKKELPEEHRIYGPTISYTYGQQPGQSDCAV